MHSNKTLLLVGFSLFLSQIIHKIPCAIGILKQSQTTSFVFDLNQTNIKNLEQYTTAVSDLQMSFAQSFFYECVTFLQKISPKFPFTKKYFLFVFVALLSGFETLSAAELPTGGAVEAGQATISQTAHTLNVDQTSQRAVVSWQSFHF